MYNSGSNTTIIYDVRQMFKCSGIYPNVQKANVWSKLVFRPNLKHIPNVDGEKHPFPTSLTWGMWGSVKEAYQNLDNLFKIRCPQISTSYVNELPLIKFTSLAAECKQKTRDSM